MGDFLYVVLSGLIITDNQMLNKNTTTGHSHTIRDCRLDSGPATD